jgi:hypothetical protein
MANLRKVVVALIVAAALVILAVPAASATTNTPNMKTEAALFGGSSLLGTQTTNYSSGDSMTSTVSLDSPTTSITIGGDGYPCGDVAYNGIVKWYMAITNWVSWTYHSHFGVHVCHNKVGYKTSLYDEPTSIMPTWNWCGNVVKEWAMNPNNASAHSHTKGCFNLVDKILVQKFPWVRITIGGNGNLWARSTGVDG